MKGYVKLLKATSFLSVLLISIAFSLFAQVSAAQSEDVPVTIKKNDGWMIFQSDVITIMFPAKSRHPMFLWWYTKQNDTVYAVHYKGLIEYYVPRLGETFTRRRVATAANLIASFFQERREALQYQVRRLEAFRMRLRNASEAIMQLSEVVDESAEDRIDRAIVLVDILREIASIVAEKAREIDETAIEERASDIAAKLEALKSKLEELKEEGGPIRVLALWREISEIFTGVRELVIAQMETVKSRITTRALFLRRLYLLLKELESRLHPPLFAFFNGEWELTPVENIKDSNGKVIGLSFAFNLTRVHDPVWKFAEGNVLIRCRLYSVPVEESSGDLSYTVKKGEMKMDFVVKGWQWNIDEVAETVKELRDAGVNVTAPNVERAGLALWLDLTSAGFERVRNLRQVGETFEEIGNTSSLKKTAEEIMDSARELTEVAREGYGSLSQALPTVQGVTTTSSTDRAGVSEEILHLTDRSVSDVIEKLRDIKHLIAEAVSYVEGSPNSDRYVLIGNDLTLAIDQAIERLRSVNETLTSLLDVENKSALNETLIAALNEYKAAFEELRESVVSLTNELQSEVQSVAAVIVQRARATRMRVGEKIVDLRNRYEEDEKPIDVGAAFGKRLKMGFATDSETLPGWFRFVNAAELTYPNGTETTGPVKAAYLEVGNYMRLYLTYPYFDSATLEHDPSIGLEVPETTSPEAEEPQYKITPPEGDQNVPSAVEPAESEEHFSALTPMTPLLPAVAVAVVVAAVVVLYVRKK